MANKGEKVKLFFRTIFLTLFFGNTSYAASSDLTEHMLLLDLSQSEQEIFLQTLPPPDQCIILQISETLYGFPKNDGNIGGQCPAVFGVAGTDRSLNIFIYWHESHDPDVVPSYLGSIDTAGHHAPDLVLSYYSDESIYKVGRVREKTHMFMPLPSVYESEGKAPRMYLNVRLYPRFSP